MVEDAEISNMVISSDENQTSVAPTPVKHFTKLKDFLIHYKYVKRPDGPGPTHTRIGEEKTKIYGGSYHIPEDQRNLFWKLYHKEIVSKNKVEYLTEKQNTDGTSPIAVDLDLHFALDVPERVYTQDHLDDMVDVYLAELKDIYQFDEDSQFNIFLFEKDTINRVVEKNITKDGIHMIIGIQMDHKAQKLLRERVIGKVAECWGDFPLVNTWNDVFDEGVTLGYTNWQLYGSCKPKHTAYKLTNVYEVSYDPEDGEFINNRGKPEEYLTAEKFPLLSVQYRNHPHFFYKTSFMTLIDCVAVGTEINQLRRRTPVPGLIENGFEFGEGSGSSEICKIKNREDLENYLHKWLDAIPSREYKLREMYEYTSILPESYYGAGSYAKWMRVAWALKNTSNKLLIVWISFSAKASTFDFHSIPELCAKWDGFDKKTSTEGVTNRSIIFWAIQHNPEGADAVRKNTISYYLDLTINSVSANNIASAVVNAKGAGDYDIAVVLHQMYKDAYVCADVKNGIWYYFKDHLWKQIDSGTYLRKAISNELRQLYESRAGELQNYLVSLENDTEDEKIKHTKARLETIFKIVQRLGQTSDKKNIMQEARDLFYDPEFYDRLDSKPYLLCCSNGVVDFKEKIFRKGLPEDYLTKCTEIDYYPLSESRHVPYIPLLEDFMAKLFVKDELREYMWNHLSAILIGMPSLNQTFHNYIGFGQNGKSVLTDLMTQTLGSYKVAAPISLITQGRGKIGGLAPEVVALKGARYVVMQEPESTDVVHEGPMKEYVSGVETIVARAPYMTEPVRFQPQFALVVCCNQFMTVRTQDHGTWRRFRVVPFESLFTPKPVDGDPDKPHQFLIDDELIGKFAQWRETFLAMLVSRAYVNQGRVIDCPTVLSASNEYRERQDYLAEFVRDKVVKCDGSTVRKSQLSEEFKMWYNINFGTKNPRPQNLYEYMDKRYGRCRNGIWRDVKIKFHEEDDDIQDYVDVENSSIDEEEGADIELNEL